MTTARNGVTRAQGELRETIRQYEVMLDYDAQDDLPSAERQRQACSVLPLYALS